MSASLSPLNYIGNKNCIADPIDAILPFFIRYVEVCMGSAELFFHLNLVGKEVFLNDFSGNLVNFWRTLQDNRNLTWLLGRIVLSSNSEYAFEQNRELLRNTPNVLDDLRDANELIKSATPEQIEKAARFYEQVHLDRNATPEELERAAAFYENQFYSFSSTGQTFGIDIRDIARKIPKIIAASAKIRNACILHRDYKDVAMQLACEHGVLFFDPPYLGTEGMYPQGSFGETEHEILFRLCYEIHVKFNGKCKFIITYNDCPYIRSLAEKYGFFTLVIQRKHNMRQRVEAGGMFSELLIANYDMVGQAEENHMLHVIMSSQMDLFGEN